MALPSIEHLSWRGDDALSISNHALCVVVSRHGGQIVSLRGVAGGPEALWQPPWPGVRPTAADERWGPAAEAPLLGNICGWNCCLDRFGLRDDDGGRPLHGEASVLPWELTAGNACLHAAVQLPLAGLRIERVISVCESSVVVETTVVNEAGVDRDIEWCEHISLGDPLIDGAEVHADAAWARLAPDAGAHAACRFSAPPGAEVEPQAALAIPSSTDPVAGDIVALALNTGAWQVRNPNLGWQLSATFDIERFPWLCLWTEHQARTSLPWAGVTRVRGMECSTKPFPEGLPPAERYPSFGGRPTRCLCPAAASLHSRIELTWQTF